MLNQPPTQYHRAVWLVLARKIGQVRDMITAVTARDPNSTAPWPRPSTQPRQGH